MNNRLRRSAYLRSFFCFVRGLGHPIGRAGGPDREAGTPQIKNSSSDLELLNLTSFDGEVTSFTLERTSLMVDDTS